MAHFWPIFGPNQNLQLQKVAVFDLRLLAHPASDNASVTYGFSEDKNGKLVPWRTLEFVMETIRRSVIAKLVIVRRNGPTRCALHPRVKTQIFLFRSLTVSSCELGG